MSLLIMQSHRLERFQSMRFEGEPGFWQRVFLVVGLSAVGVGRPLLARIASHPDIPFGYRVGPIALAALPFGLIIGPAFCIAALGELSRCLGVRVARVVRRAISIVLLALIIIEILHWISFVEPPFALFLGLVGSLALSFLPVLPAWIRSLRLTGFACAVLSGIVLAAYFLPSAVRAQFQVSGSATRTPVIVLVFDQLPTSSLLGRDARIAARWYPSFAWLSRHATWYRNATGSSDYPAASISSIMTGTVRLSGAVPDQSLVTALAPTHDLSVSEDRIDICPRDLCTHRPPSDVFGFLGALSRAYVHSVIRGSADPPSAGSLAHDPVRSTLADYDRILTRIKPIESGRPQAVILDEPVPEGWWDYLPSGRRYAGRSLIFGTSEDRWTSARWPVIQGQQRHLLEAQLADRMLGRAISRLRRAGVWDKSLVVVASDRGVSFDRGTPREQAAPSTLAGIAYVPLFIKYPHQKSGSTDDRRARTIDVLPTVADELNLHLGSGTDGVSLRQKRPSAAEVAVTVNGRSRAISRPGKELLADRAASVRARIALFGPSGESAGPYAVRTSPALLGAAVRSYRQGTTAAMAVVDGAPAFDVFDPASTLAPSAINGVVEGRGAGLVKRVAVAVNGIIAGSVPTYVLAGKVRYSALVSDAAFRRGRNEVAIYAISPRPPLSLSYLGDATGSEAYALTAGGTRLRTHQGDVEISPGEIAGYADEAHVASGIVEIAGWAADVKHKAPFDRVVAFVGGQKPYVISTGITRLDVAAAYHDRHLSTSGFALELPTAFFRRSGRQRPTRIFAIGQHAASELLYHADFPWQGSYDLRAHGDRLVVVTPAGRAIPVRRPTAGYVEKAGVTNGVAHFSGWAADMSLKRLPTAVVLFSGRESIAGSLDPVTRPDVALALHSARLARSGFLFLAPRRSLGRTPNVRVFAIFDSYASELSYLHGYPWRRSP